MVGKSAQVQLAARWNSRSGDQVEDFCYKATETVEKHLDFNKIIKWAKHPNSPVILIKEIKMILLITS